jgi:hypothetical protein
MARRLVVLAAGAVVAAAVAGCSKDSARPPAASSISTRSSGGAEPSSAHPCGVANGQGRTTNVMWIWMENHTAGSVLGSADAPYENTLVGQCGSSTTYQAVGSPSLPNYIAATSGDTFGLTDDAAPDGHRLTADNLFRQARSAGGTSRSYEEAMTSPCQQSSSGTYAVKHNPAAYYTGENDRDACTTDNLALGDTTSGPLADDLAHDTLPTFSFVTPDLCHDTHDCSVAEGDRWLAGWLPPILDSPAYSRGTMVVFIVWDEPTPMPLLVVSPRIASGTTATVTFNHYSLLRTTEELLGYPLLGHAGNATSMQSTYAL